MLTGPLNAFPWVINGVVEAAVSIRRVGEFLTLPHMKRDEYFEAESMKDGADVELFRATFSHARQQMALQFTLDNVSFAVIQGQVRNSQLITLHKFSDPFPSSIYSQLSRSNSARGSCTDLLTVGPTKNVKEVLSIFIQVFITKIDLLLIIVLALKEAYA